MIIAKPSKEFINPKTLIAPAAAVYSHIAKVNRGMIVYISGQVPSDASGKIIGEGDFEAQVEIARSDETLRLTKHLTRILFVGQKPETVDFSDPTLPPGFNAEKINAGIAIAVAKIGERGWQGSTCMITPDEAGRAMLEKALKGAVYDCVVIGGGLRIPPKSLPLFEMVINAVHKAAPGATIAFNTRTEDTAEAAARQLDAA